MPSGASPTSVAEPLHAHDVPDRHRHLNVARGEADGDILLRHLRPDRHHVPVVVRVQHEPPNQGGLPDCGLPDEAHLRLHPEEPRPAGTPRTVHRLRAWWNFGKGFLLESRAPLRFLPFGLPVLLTRRPARMEVSVVRPIPISRTASLGWAGVIECDGRFSSWPLCRPPCW